MRSRPATAVLFVLVATPWTLSSSAAVSSLTVATNPRCHRSSPPTLLEMSSITAFQHPPRYGCVPKSVERRRRWTRSINDQPMRPRPTRALSGLSMSCSSAGFRSPSPHRNPTGTRQRGDSSLLQMRGGGGGGDDEGSEDEGRRRHRGVSIALFLTYLTVMGAKCALPATLPLLASAHSGLVHPPSSTFFGAVVPTRRDLISRLLAVSTMAIAAGKLCLGPVIDALGGMASLRVALVTIFVAMGLGIGGMGAGAGWSSSWRFLSCNSLADAAYCFIAVDLAFSVCWAACVKAVRDRFEEDEWAGEIGRLAVAARSGNAIAFAGFAGLLQWAQRRGAAAASAGAAAAVSVDDSWRWVFRVSGAVQLVPLAMLAYFGQRERKRKLDTDGAKDRQVALAKRKEGNVDGDATDPSEPFSASIRRSLTVLRREARAPEFWLHFASRATTMVLVSFLLFIPSLMTHCYDMSSSSAARVGSAFAMGCLLSSLLLSKPYARLSPQGKARSAVGFLGGSIAVSVAQLTHARGIVTIPPAVGAFLMFLWGFCLAVPFYLPATTFALKRGGEESSATIADAFDFGGFALLAVFNGFVAKARQEVREGWVSVFGWTTAASAVALVSLVAAVLTEGRADDERGRSRVD